MLWSLNFVLCALCFVLCAFNFILQSSYIYSILTMENQSTKFKDQKPKSRIPSINLFRCLRNQKLRRHNHRNVKPRGGIEKTNACLTANVCQMSKVPRN